MTKITSKVIFRGVAFICLTMMSTGVFAQPEGKEPPTFAGILEKMDTNKDGKISSSEAKGPMKENFSTIDSNKDGYITETEFKNAPRPERKAKK